MNNLKLAIIYYSSTGTNYQLSKWAEASAKEMGADVRLLKVEELAPEMAINLNPKWKTHIEETQEVPHAASEDLEWADAIIFSMPTRFGNLPSQMKQFLDIQGGYWAQGKLGNKVVSAMCAAGNSHGGQEVTIQALYTSMMHWGAIIAAPGYMDPSSYKAGGNPYGVSVTIDQDGNMLEDVEEAVKYQAKRTVEIARWIKKGQQ